MKKCVTCRKQKPIELFLNQKKNGYTKVCLPCRIRNRQISSRTYYKSRTDTPKHIVSQLDTQKIMDSQGGKCGICQSTMNRSCLDHDHKTGKVRGILCVSCNAGLGNFQDNPEILGRAISYLAKIPAIDKFLVDPNLDS
jgi:hypothetical protein